MNGSGRWSLIEYGAPVDLVGSISDSVGLLPNQISELLLKGGLRAAKALSFSSNPISVLGSHVRAVGMAGLLRISPGIEIEIAPKFLGLDSENARWREDFFYLATLSKHGRLLTSERLGASSGGRGDLHTLVARAMVDLFWSNHRRPLRAYRIHRFSDFSIEGDIEPDAIYQPGQDGFEQFSIIYDRRNPFNSTILAAVRQILPNLRDPSVIGQLERMIQALAPQRSVSGPPQNRSMPSRSKRWQPLYDLSVDVLNGFGLTFENKNAIAPGYVLDTWRVWEDLLGIAFRLGFGGGRVKSQRPSVLGERERVSNGSEGRFVQAIVKPDLMIFESDRNQLKFLVDAKYKGHVEKDQLRISEADIYEALAFAKATGCEKVLLAYPPSSSKNLQLGQVTIFEKIKVGSVMIFGAEIGIKEISRSSGLINFSKRCTYESERIIDGH